MFLLRVKLAGYKVPVFASIHTEHPWLKTVTKSWLTRRFPSIAEDVLHILDPLA